MLSDAISSYYEAKKLYYAAESNSKEEERRLNLVTLAIDNLFDNCRSYEEWRRISNHIGFLCDRYKWPTLYNNVSALNTNINSKVGPALKSF